MSRTIRLACAVFLVGALFGPSARAQAPLVTDLGLLPGDATVATAVNSQQDHSIAKGGDQYLVAWSDYRAQSSGASTNQSGGDVFAIRLDATGSRSTRCRS